MRVWFATADMADHGVLLTDVLVAAVTFYMNFVVTIFKGSCWLFMICTES